MPRIGARSKDAAHFDAVEHRQVEVQDDEIRGLRGHALQRDVAARDDFRFGVADALERVLDEAGDVLFIFNDKNAMLGHAVGPH